MLKPTRRSQSSAATERFAIVASEYNRRYVDGMLRQARATLREAGAATVQVVRVPGAFEIPVVVSRLAEMRDPGVSAILCLGVILRGETTHAQAIADAVTWALARIQVDRGMPVIHEVLLFENEEQARVRCLGRQYNRGAEAAQTAIRMARTIRALIKG
ncbi:MAG: 6,7-dimethyl-8-ribityllumazine synthase [Verrucomicrobia bacterium]|nr:6,7-dimethyl-8-ribityllumazine synthase [Verrucomicrobiota bacterium]